MVSERTDRRRRATRRKSRNMTIRPTSFNEIAVPGNYVFAGVNYDEIMKITPVAPQELLQMIDMDGHARALFDTLRRPILRNTKRAYVKPYAVGEGEDEAEFIYNNILKPRHLGGTEIPFTSTVAKMCMAFVTGFVAFEKVWDKPGTVVDDGLIRLRKLAPRDFSTINIMVDDKGMYDGIHQKASWRGRTIDRKVPKDKSCLYAINEEEDPLYGKSAFLPAYYHFDKKHKLYYVTHLALALGAVPPRISRAKPTVSDTDRKRFLMDMNAMGSNAAMILPDGIEIDPAIQLPVAQTGLPYVEMIEHHNREMSKSLIAQFLDVGTGAGGGSGFSLSKNHMDFLVMSLEDRMNSMAEMYNNFIIPELIDWNFGTQNYPTLVFPPFTSDTRDLLFESFKAITAAREVPFSGEFMAELEKSVANELDFEVQDSAIEEHAAARIEQQEKDVALEQDLKEKTLKEPSMAEQMANAPAKNGPSGGPNRPPNKPRMSDILNDPEFIKLAENVSVRVRQRLAQEAFSMN